MWLIGITGILYLRPSSFAKFNPTFRLGFYPGPIVTAIAFIWFIFLPDYFSAFSKTIGKFWAWCFSASIGAFGEWKSLKEET